MTLRLSALLLLAACPAARTPAGETVPPPSKTPAAQPSTVLDQGTFSFTVQGRDAGEESFTITGGGSTREIRTKTILRAGNDRVTEGVLRTDESFRPQSGEFTQIAGTVTRRTTLKREGDKLVAQSPGETDATGTGDLFAMNGVLIHFGAVCELAGDAAKPITIFPGVKITLGAVQTETVPVGERMIDLRLVPIVGPTALDVYCDGKKPILFEQPGTGFAAVREGYSDLADLVTHVPKLPIPPELEQQPRTVKVEGGELACSLLLPKQRKKPLPAVFFLTGSGPQDRDEDTIGRGGGKMSMFRRLAVSLAQAGVASLRCDDRGVGESSGGNVVPTIEVSTNDALAMAAVLRAEKGTIDPARIGVIGHSEGATTAPVAAVRGKLRAVVLLAGMGRPIDQILAEQNAAAMRDAGMAEADIARENARAQRIYQAIREGKPLPDTLKDEERKRVEILKPWLESQLRHDPLAAAARLTMPVLIAQGGKDFQVSTKDAEALRGALSRNKRVAYKLYPQLSHLFAPVKAGTLADYSDPSLQVDSTFVADVTAFARKSLTSP